jgi:hypothetical protein
MYKNKKSGILSYEDATGTRYSSSAVFAAPIKKDPVLLDEMHEKVLTQLQASSKNFDPEKLKSEAEADSDSKTTTAKHQISLATSIEKYGYMNEQQRARLQQEEQAVREQAEKDFQIDRKNCGKSSF